MHWYDTINETYVKNAVIGYMQEAPLEVFNLFPMVSTAKMSGLVPSYVKADWFKIGDVDAYKRAGATESIGDDFATSSISYQLEQYSFHKDVTKADVEQVESPYAAIDDAARFVVNRLRRVSFKLIHSVFMQSGVWATDNNVSSTAENKWDNKASNESTADPVEQVLTWKQSIEKVTGFDPRKLIVTPDVYKALRTNTLIRSMLKTTSDQVVTKDALAKLMDLDQLVVMNAVNEGADGYYDSKKALLIYTPNKTLASKEEPSAGVIMGYKGHGGYPTATRRIPMPMKNDALRVETDFFLDPVVTAADCGYYAYNVVS
jgi:hypothetical protein